MLNAELARVESNLRRVEAFLHKAPGLSPLAAESSDSSFEAYYDDDDDDAKYYEVWGAEQAVPEQPWAWPVPLLSRMSVPVGNVVPVALPDDHHVAQQHHQQRSPAMTDASVRRLASPTAAAALAGRHSKSAIIAAVEQARRSAAPFAPTINSVRRVSAPHGGVRHTCGCCSSILWTAPILKRVAFVQRPAQRSTYYTQQRREEMLAERAARVAAEEVECTFKPQTGRAPRRSSSPGGSLTVDTVAAGERLYKLALQRSAALEAKRAEKEQVWVLGVTLCCICARVVDGASCPPRTPGKCSTRAGIQARYIADPACTQCIARAARAPQAPPRACG
jgi:hypothetical protein